MSQFLTNKGSILREAVPKVEEAQDVAESIRSNKP